MNSSQIVKNNPQKKIFESGLIPPDSIDENYLLLLHSMAMYLKYSEHRCNCQ